MLALMRIFGAHDVSGCGYYRMVVPLTEVGKHEGYEVGLTLQGGGYDSYAKPDEFDVFVGQRAGNYGGLSYWRGLRRGHNRLVYENDDDVFSLTRENPAFEAYAQLDVRAAIQAYLTYSDRVTVTTEHLADVLGQYSCERPAVLPNFIRGFALDLPRTESKRMRLGYMGATSHGRDVELATEPVRRFMRHNPSWELNLLGSDYRASFRVPGDRMKMNSWTHILDDDEAFYRAIDFDVAIAPLLDNRFNRSKSYIKALEYNARGIPVIASDVGPYREFVQHGVNGFLVSKNHEWGSYLNLLASDDDLRETMGKQAREVATQYTIEKNWKLWADAYESMW